MHKAFFGDRERDFSLTSEPILRELEHKTSKATGALVDDFLRRRAAYVDIVQTIRLGLIGGGENPQEAHRLVSTYVPMRPLGEAHILALDIITDLWAGPEEPVFRDATDDEKASVEQRVKRGAQEAIQHLFSDAEAAATGDLSAASNGGAA